MAGYDFKPNLPPGLFNGLVFFGVVIFGSGYIIFSKLHEFGALAATAVPVLIMVGYAVLLGARLFRLRDDQSGDNLYYMGFLFTLTSLAVSLYQFSAAGSAEQIVQNFGIAIASTIAGITLRILFNQMRRDPVEVEATARMELAEASRRLKRELESVIMEFGYFRRATQQSVTDAVDEAQESIGKAHKEFSGELKKLSSQRSEQALDGLNERTVQVLDVSRQLVREGEQLAKSTAKIVGAIDSLFVKLASRQTPEQIIQSELAPLIQSLTQALNSLHSSVETQARNTEVNLEHAQSVVVAVNQLLQEIHAQEIHTPEAPRLPAPWPQRVATDEP